MKKWIIACLMAFPLVANAQQAQDKESKDHQVPEQKAGFEKKEGATGTAKTSTETIFPFEGEVTCERLNVRMFPHTKKGSIIATILKTGALVKVVGETNGFYQIAPPPDCSVWIFGKNVESTETIGTVISNNTPIRLDSRMTSQKLGTLNQGDSVTILKNHMGWCKITSPESVPYFVGGRYIRKVRDLAPPIAAPEVRAATPTEDALARAKMMEAETLIAENSVILNAPARIKNELTYAGVILAFEEALTLTNNELLQKEIQANLTMYKAAQKSLDVMRQELMTMDVIRKRMEEELKARTIKPQTFLHNGYVHTVGLVVGRPCEFQLMNGGKRVVFVKPATPEIREQLRQTYKEYVGINGTVVPDPNEHWIGSTMIIVTEVVALTPPTSTPVTTRGTK